MLDFVPNHMGLGHPWIEDHPEYFIQGTERDLASAPQNYTWVKRQRGDLLLARSRLLPGLARYTPTQLWQPVHAGGDDP
jgi:glycosidase